MDKTIKLKTRSKFSALDLKYLSFNLTKQLSGCVLNNIQDITVRSYLFKLGRSNQRENLFIDSGTKLSLIEGVEETRDKPNRFTQKVRKCIKGLFIESIEQIGVERVIRITFKGADKNNKDFIYFIYVEFYAKGNIILTNYENYILACLRDHQYSETEKVSQKEIYPLHKAASIYIENIFINEQKMNELLNQSTKVKYSKLLSQLVPCAHQVLIDIFLQKEGINPNQDYQESHKQTILKCAEEIKKLFENKAIETEEEIKEQLRGYLYYQKDKKYSFEFSPVQVPFIGLKSGDVIEKQFDNFNDSINEHFKQFNIKKSAEEIEMEIEKEAMKKYQKIQQDQHGRLKGIQDQIDTLYQQATLIEQHVKEVDGIIDIVNDLVNMGIANLIKDSVEQAQKEGDPLALMINKVLPESSKVIITLKTEENKEILIKIDLKLNASQNASVLYVNRKKLIEKEEKTKQATEQVLKKAHLLAIKEIQNKKLQFKKKEFSKERKIYWFEKFYWFLTSENYLVITARDAQQNEVLIKRYLNKNDIVFHAHIQGSAFTVIKNHTDHPVSMLSINETAVAALAHSKAWNLNVVVQVYWVYANQVSKTAPTGLSMPSGSFMIYGKKNFINPLKLEMGFGLLFKVDEESAKRHQGERRIKTDVYSEQQIQDEEKNDDNELLEEKKEPKKMNTLEQLIADQDDNQTQIKITKKMKQVSNNQTKKKKGKVSKNEIKEEKQEQQTKNKGKKATKKKQKKIDDYLEKFGGESKEEEAVRMQLQGYHKNYKVEQQKKEYEWATEEGEEIKFEDVKEDQETKLEQEGGEQPEKTSKQMNKKYLDLLNVGLQEEKLEANFFDSFTAAPKKEDVLLQVYPVCAPYNILNKYKYKIKLIPGQTKRGKALKLIHEIFNQQQGETQEKDMIKFLPESVSVLQITGNCKVQAAGVVKIKKQNKKMKKQTKKNN